MSPTRRSSTRRSSAAALLAGAHMSIAGGIDRAVDRAAEVGCRAMQIFTKSSSQWRARPLLDPEVREFRRKIRDHGIRRVLAHNSYLINMASPDDSLWRKSIAAMVEELERCEMLGVPSLICHPGAHKGAGPDAGLERIAQRQIVLTSSEHSSLSRLRQILGHQSGGEASLRHRDTLRKRARLLV